MPADTLTPQALLLKLSQALDLEYQPQDWGIINANGARFDEFVSYFEATALTPTQKFELAELILASANERMLDGGSVNVAQLLAIARREKEAFGFHIAYWMSIAVSEEFPLGRALLECTNEGT